MKTLKVWGGRYFSSKYGKGKTTRAFVAAYTKKQAVEISGVSYSEITNYWSITGNENELSIAKEIGFWVYAIDENHNEYSAPIIRVK